ncbi:MAG: 3-isopropylmalate dehydratase large subunit [Bacillota bacterium]
MGQTITQKILAKKAGLKSVKAGELITAELDIVLANDITAPVAIAEFKKMGAKKVYNKNNIVLVPDHFVPNKDIKSAEQAKVVREFSKAQGIVNYFELGCMGIEHALLPEKGLVTAGDCIIGADSHTCTYGALGAFATGVGSTDMAAGMAEGYAWFKVPEAIKVNITGTPNKYVSGKDIILYLIGKIGVDGARYMSLEFMGDGLKHISMDSRFSMANMAIEAGAKNGIFEVDSLTLDYIAEHSVKPYEIFTADDDAEYAYTLDIDLSTISPMVAYPHLPSNTHKAEDSNHIMIDQVVIGSCTNGRIEDMRQTAEIFKGRKVADGVRCIVIPATQKVWLQCVQEGLMEIFINANIAVSTPTCGPCLGGHMGILAKGERCVATTNRNFVGRMGHVESEIYLASPYVASASAIAGYITTPDKL